eukprot:5802664-Pyramimonas_sp.AAC.1
MRESNSPAEQGNGLLAAGVPSALGDSLATSRYSGRVDFFLVPFPGICSLIPCDWFQTLEYAL